MQENRKALNSDINDEIINIKAQQRQPKDLVKSDFGAETEPKDRQNFDVYQSPATFNFVRLRKGNGKKGTINNKPAVLFEGDNYQSHCFLSPELNYDDVKRSLNTNTSKFLLLVLKKAAEQIPLKASLENISINDRTITIKQKEIKEFFGIKDKKYAKNIIINSSRALLNFHHTLTFPHYNKKQVAREIGFNMTILDKYDYQNGTVILQLSDNFSRYIPQQFIAQYPNNIGQYSGTAHQITTYICDLYRIQHKRKKHKNYVLIKIKTLLERTSTIPTIDKLNKNNERHYNRKIVEPLDNALDEIESFGDFKSTYYCNSKGAPLTETQLKDGKFMQYENFKKLSFIFVFKEKKYDTPQVNESIKKQKFLK